MTIVITFASSIVITSLTKTRDKKMGFTKDESYWQYRLKTINNAIKGNKEALETKTAKKSIDAHKSYIKDLEKQKITICEELKKSKGF